MRGNPRVRSNVDRTPKIVRSVKPPAWRTKSSGRPVCCECRKRPAKIGDYCTLCLDALGERVRAELGPHLGDGRRSNKE